MNARSKRMTLQQVAERAGVSAPTISKVLNGRPDVSPETRERVLKVLREEQYLPRGASSLPMAHIHIELVFDALVTPNNLEITRGIVEAASEQGAHVAISTLPADLDVRPWINELERLGRAGLVIVTARLSADQQQQLQRASLPLVLIDPLSAPDPSLASVGAGNWQGGLTAVQHLLELGHRRIAMLRGRESVADRARYHGYVAALAGHGINVDESLIGSGDFRFEPTVPVALEILQRPDPPTAVFAANDAEALAVIEAARRLGKRVPEDLSVVGFDDNLIASVSSPRLTTVRQPFVQMGAVAYRVLTELMAGGESDVARVELATTLVVRESTTAPRQLVPGRPSPP